MHSEEIGGVLPRGSCLSIFYLTFSAHFSGVFLQPTHPKSHVDSALY